MKCETLMEVLKQRLVKPGCSLYLHFFFVICIFVDLFLQQPYEQDCDDFEWLFTRKADDQ